MQIEIFESIDREQLRDEVNEWINKYCYDDNFEKSLEIVDIKFHTCYDSHEKTIVHYAMVCYKELE